MAVHQKKTQKMGLTRESNCLLGLLKKLMWRILLNETDFSLF